MNAIKKLFSKLSRKKKQDDECWYNNTSEKKIRRWHPPTEGCYDAANHEIAQTNQIGKRQH